MNPSKRVARAIRKSHEAADVFLQTRVQSDVAEAIRLFAKEEGISVAAYVRRLLKQHVDAQG